MKEDETIKRNYFRQPESERDFILLISRFQIVFQKTGKKDKWGKTLTLHQGNISHYNRITTLLAVRK